MSFAGQHVVVTGGSTGIGRATAELLGQRGARVSLIARSPEALAQAVDAIVGAGGCALAAPADVADKLALAAAFDRAEAGYGPVDGLFANAGQGGGFAPFADYDDAVWDAVIGVNLTAVFRAIKRVLPGMIARRRGCILVTGSLASERGMANNPAYVASKHGVLGLARAAAIEAAPHGVRVNCLLPGLIDTPMLHDVASGDPSTAMAALARNIPQGRVGAPREAGEVAAFLLSDAASHVTGQAWAVDGGILGTLTLGH